MNLRPYVDSESVCASIAIACSFPTCCARDACEELLIMNALVKIGDDLATALIRR